MFEIKSLFIKSMLGRSRIVYSVSQERQEAMILYKEVFEVVELSAGAALLEELDHRRMNKTTAATSI